MRNLSFLTTLIKTNFLNTKCLSEVIYCKNYKAKIKITKILLKMDFRIIELQKQLSENEKNTFNYKFEKKKKLFQLECF